MKHGPVVLVRTQGRLGQYAAPARRDVERWLRAAGCRLGVDQHHEISVLLTDNPTIRRLNRRWRRVDRPTDVLAFAMHEHLTPGRSPSAGPLGDIVISLPYTRRAARDADRSPRQHLAFVAIHGLLHLLGHDHQRPEETERMDVMEQTLLKEIDVA